MNLACDGVVSMLYTEEGLSEYPYLNFFVVATAVYKMHPFSCFLLGTLRYFVGKRWVVLIFTKFPMFSLMGSLVGS